MPLLIGEYYKVHKDLHIFLNEKQPKNNEEVQKLLQWLKNFYKYTIISTSPLTIRIDEILNNEYSPLPKDYSLKRKLTKEEAEELVLKYLHKKLNNNQYLPLNIENLSKEIIKENNIDYYNEELINTIKRMLKENTEQNYNSYSWVDSYTYKPIEYIQKWSKILQDFNISPKQAAIEWYMQEPSKIAIENYKKAQEAFLKLTGTKPILTRGYKLLK